MKPKIEKARIPDGEFRVGVEYCDFPERAPSHKTPPTWNDALNAMSAEEKAKWMQVYGSHFHDIAKAYAYRCSINQDRTFDGAYREKMSELLASPYDGGKAQEGAE